MPTETKTRRARISRALGRMKKDKGGRPGWGVPMVTRTIFVPKSWSDQVERDAAAALPPRNFSRQVMAWYSSDRAERSARDHAEFVAAAQVARQSRGESPSTAPASSRSSTRANVSRDASSGASVSQAPT